MGTHGGGRLTVDGPWWVEGKGWAWPCIFEARRMPFGPLASARHFGTGPRPAPRPAGSRAVGLGRAQRRCPGSRRGTFPPPFPGKPTHGTMVRVTASAPGKPPFVLCIIFPTCPVGPPRLPGAEESARPSAPGRLPGAVESPFSKPPFGDVPP